MADNISQSYDQVPYRASPRHQTHPNTLAVAGKLMGLDPAPIDRCSVLELGCATGGNLLPIAAMYPGSRFVGIDLSPRQIEMGQLAVKQTGATNIDLRAMSITDITPEFGQFDYIICHGVYTWVPEAVAEKILEVCRENLTAHGIAYISYNTYPGWHQRGMIREMLQYHAAHFQDPHQRVAECRRFVELLAQHAPKGEEGFHAIIEEEAELIRKEEDFYVFHEHLEDSNAPIYFHEFAQRLARHGLQFLGEAPLSAGAVGLRASTLHGFLKEFPEDPIEQEQYFDFVRNRTFRRSLVCHAGLELRRPPLWEPIETMHVESLARPASQDINLYDQSEAAFELMDGHELKMSHPHLKTAIKVLHEQWPGTMAFAELCQRLRDRLEDNGVEVNQAFSQSIARMLYQLYLGAIVDLHTLPPPICLRPSGRPVAFSVSRMEAGQEMRQVTNLRHRTVKLDGFDLVVLRNLDGSCTIQELIARLHTAINQGELSLEKDGQSPDASQVRSILENEVPASLHRLATSALLVG